jgi:hypothetical protein
MKSRKNMYERIALENRFNICEKLGGKLLSRKGNNVKETPFYPTVGRNGKRLETPFLYCR